MAEGENGPEPEQELITNICPGLWECSKEDEHYRGKLGNTVLAPGQSLGFRSLYSVFSGCFAFEDNLQKYLTESFCEGKGMKRLDEPQDVPLQTAQSWWEGCAEAGITPPAREPRAKTSQG